MTLSLSFVVLGFGIGMQTAKWGMALIDQVGMHIGRNGTHAFAASPSLILTKLGIQWDKFIMLKAILLIRSDGHSTMGA